MATDPRTAVEEERLRRIEHLVRRLEHMDKHESREIAEELMQAVLGFHGSGL